ncbi:AAC(3) family N-acetyltransferase [Campylobacter sp. TTU_617]|uniref:AAC(3) family N-acetyltransferase n=1 Tax=Campylobacter sp. TTU_617 TaxID=2768148 RepID=UPI0019075705|nr:AAC(3) family N-acetyltransferase [Campylobacter sp. TTU_617]MBK1972355.1 AAC(3) family N-acetyltransferase [Campylobacter sp. TTU_617]
MLEDFFKKLNIKEKEYILFTGNLTRLLYKLKGNARENLNSFLDIFLKQTRKGGLAIQSFNWDFCKGLSYDILNSKSQTGALANIALKRVEFKRTKHPIYSFMVANNFQKDLIELDNKGAFDKNSPFDFMYKNKAKMIIVDLPLQDSFTFVHYVEQCLKVSYRYNKSFTSFYIDEKGHKELKTYDMFVRANNVLTHIHPLEDLFLQEKVMEIVFFDEIFIKIIDLEKAYKVISKDIEQNQGLSLHILKV